MSHQIPYKSITNVGKDQDVNTLTVSGSVTLNGLPTSSSTDNECINDNGIIRINDISNNYTGTYTPTGTFTTTGTLSDTGSTGRWYRVGRLLYVNGLLKFDVNASGTITGDLRVSLPFEISADNESDTTINLGRIKNVSKPNNTVLSGRGALSTTFFTLWTSPNVGGSLSLLNDTNMVASTDGFIYFTCEYLIDL